MVADSAPNAGVIVHDPAFRLPLVRVALFVKIGELVTTEDASPFTKPVMVAVNAGAATPYVIVFASAETVSAALFTVRLPGVKVVKL